MCTVKTNENVIPVKDNNVCQDVTTNVIRNVAVRLFLFTFIR